MSKIKCNKKNRRRLLVPIRYVHVKDISPQFCFFSLFPWVRSDRSPLFLKLSLARVATSLCVFVLDSTICGGRGVERWGIGVPHLFRHQTATIPIGVLDIGGVTMQSEQTIRGTTMLRETTRLPALCTSCCCWVIY